MIEARAGSPRSGSPRVPVLAVLCGLWCWFASAPALAAENFYDQPPMTEQELLRFIDDLPVYRLWARQVNELAHPGLGGDGRPTFVYSARAAARARDLGWKPERFFCVMGRAAAALAIQEHGRPGAERPVDMPVVSPAEFNLVRRHSAALIKAGGDPQE